MYQFPRDSRLISRLPCEDVRIFLEEFDEREFLFGIQTVAHVSHLRRFLHGQWDCLAECVLWLDGRLGSLGLRHDRVWVGLGQGLLQLLELCRCQQSFGSLSILPIRVKSPLDISHDGDDATWPWHLQDQVGIVWNCHKLAECQPSEEALYTVLKSATSNCMVSVQKFYRVPKVMGRAIWPMGVAATLWTIPWMGA
jgi:hypothetical protein